MRTRLATIEDAGGMSRVLQSIVAHTGRERPSDEAFVTARYLADPNRIRCTVAVDDAGTIMGFQSLKKAAAGNQYDVPTGWGIIGTHIAPHAHRQGVGTALFVSSLDAAKQVGLKEIDAYIAADNASGLRYYDAMGFRTYRQPDGIVQKVYTV